MAQRVRLITVVIPVYNEAPVIEVIAERVDAVFAEIGRFEHRILFINDGSTDETYLKVVQLAKKNPHVQLIDLSRNFGNQNAIAAGLRSAQGVAVITMDADLQHPAEIIKELIMKWEAGAEVVLTKRTGYKSGFGHRIFFWLLSKLSDVGLESSVSDFRLLDRKVVTVLNTFTEREKFFRGMVHWVGFRRVYAEYRVSDRLAGQSRFSISKLFKLGIVGFTSFSTFPLRLSLLFGIPIFLGSLVALSFMTFAVFFLSPDYFRPIAFVTVLNALLSGVMLICLGSVAKYLEIVYSETRGRPSFIVRERINIDEEIGIRRDGYYSNHTLEQTFT